MAPVAAAVSTIGSALFSTSGVTAAAGAVGAYSAYKTATESEKSQKKQQALAQEQLELQKKAAGEYYELTRQQMELQAQESNINTLVDLIQKRNEPPPTQVVTLPTAKTYTPAQKINMAIDEFIKGL